MTTVQVPQQRALLQKGGSAYVFFERKVVIESKASYDVKLKQITLPSVGYEGGGSAPKFQLVQVQVGTRSYGTNVQVNGEGLVYTHRLREANGGTTEDVGAPVTSTVLFVRVVAVGSLVNDVAVVVSPFTLTLEYKKDYEHLTTKGRKKRVKDEKVNAPVVKP